jgi:hypothetical protein
MYKKMKEKPSAWRMQYSLKNMNAIKNAGKRYFKYGLNVFKKIKAPMMNINEYM